MDYRLSKSLNRSASVCGLVALPGGGTDIRIVQVLLGHGRLSTIAGYTQVATALIANTTCPLDRLNVTVTPSDRPPAVQPALEVADIFRRHAAAYRAEQASHLSNTRRRVMAAIEACRRAAIVRLQWLADRQPELLVVPYFHIMFTMPAPLAPIALQNRPVVYGRRPIRRSARPRITRPRRSI